MTASARLVAHGAEGRHRLQQHIFAPDRPGAARPHRAGAPRPPPSPGQRPPTRACFLSPAQRVTGHERQVSAQVPNPPVHPERGWAPGLLTVQEEGRRPGCQAGQRSRSAVTHSPQEQLRLVPSATCSRRAQPRARSEAKGLWGN